MRLACPLALLLLGACSRAPEGAKPEAGKTEGKAPLDGKAPAAGKEAPEEKPAPSPFKVLTWNIQYGSDKGPDPNGWPERKAGLARALEAERPDVLCVQEALSGQLSFLETLLPGHKRVGVGRDDGVAAGEHCAVFFDAGRFSLLESGTFWLSGTPDRPSFGWGEKYRRVCTWARLRDGRSGRAFRVFDVHFPLDAAAREKAAALVMERIGPAAKETAHGPAGERPSEPAILAGDFNCGPGSTAWKAFASGGLADSAALAGSKPGAATHLVKGIPLLCLDAVFVSAGFSARNHRVVAGPPGGARPSDHFGVAVELEFGGSGGGTAGP